MLKNPFRFGLRALGLLLALSPAPRAASYVVAGSLPGGGDCALFGSWDAGTQTCSISTLTLGAPDTLDVSDATCEVGTLGNEGAISNSGTLRIIGSVQKHGLITNYGSLTTEGDLFQEVHNYGSFDLTHEIDLFYWVNNYGSVHVSAHVFFAGLTNHGSIEVQAWLNSWSVTNSSDGQIHVQAGGSIGGPSFTLYNYGTIHNEGALNDGYYTPMSLRNYGTVVNDGTLGLGWSDHKNYGQIQNNNKLTVGKYFSNFGTIMNSSAALLNITPSTESVGHFTNEAGGAIDNAGTIRINFCNQSLGCPSFIGEPGSLMRNSGLIDVKPCNSSGCPTYVNNGDAFSVCSGTTHGLVSGTLSQSLVTLQMTPESIAWCTKPGATGYDVVRGSLNTLRSTGGDYGAAVEQCMGGGLATSLPFSAVPTASGEGSWFLARPNGGTYNDGTLTQAADVDGGIDGSGVCP